MSFTDVKNRLTITGLWPTISYLVERYPDPELLPGDCTRRALIRSFVHDLLETDEINPAFTKVPAFHKQAFLLSSVMPSLLDLAYIAASSPPDVVWLRLNSSFEAYLARRRIEEAEEPVEIEDLETLAYAN